jgi:phosphoglycolate phosphatase-like HAD superfamily hydrolase
MILKYLRTSLVSIEKISKTIIRLKKSIIINITMSIVEFNDYLKKKNKSQVIFDFDRTLVTLNIDWDYWHKDVSALFLRYDNLFDRSKYTDWATAENEFVEKYGNRLRSELINLNHKDEDDHYHGFYKNDLAYDLLLSSKDIADIHIWSSNDLQIVKQVLRELSLTEIVKTITARNDVYFIKPNPEGFSLINKNNLPKSEFVMIGDTDMDRQAAINAGIDYLDINNDFSS